MDIKHMAITGSTFYCRCSGCFSVSTSNKLSCNLTGQCFKIGNKNIPPKRYKQYTLLAFVLNINVQSVFLYGIFTYGCRNTYSYENN